MIAAGFLASISLDRHGVRHDLAVDPGLADPTSDQLGVLRTEVDDQDGVEARPLSPPILATQPRRELGGQLEWPSDTPLP